MVAASSSSILKSADRLVSAMAPHIATSFVRRLCLHGRIHVYSMTMLPLHQVVGLPWKWPDGVRNKYSRPIGDVVLVEAVWDALLRNAYKHCAVYAVSTSSVCGLG